MAEGNGTLHDPFLHTLLDCLEFSTRALGERVCRYARRLLTPAGPQPLANAPALGGPGAELACWRGWERACVTVQRVTVVGLRTSPAVAVSFLGLLSWNTFPKGWVLRFWTVCTELRQGDHLWPSGTGAKMMAGGREKAKGLLVPQPLLLIDRLVLDLPPTALGQEIPSLVSPQSQLQLCANSRGLSTWVAMRVINL